MTDLPRLVIVTGVLPLFISDSLYRPGETLVTAVDHPRLKDYTAPSASTATRPPGVPEGAIQAGDRWLVQTGDGMWAEVTMDGDDAAAADIATPDSDPSLLTASQLRAEIVAAGQTVPEAARKSALVDMVKAIRAAG